MRGALLLSIASLALASTARAESGLRTLPADTARAFAPMLVHGEMASIESDATGRPRQITLFAFVPAAPETVRAVVLDAADYPKFVRNVSKSEVEPRGDGFVNRWRVELPIGHFDDVYEVHPDKGNRGIDVKSIAPGNSSVFRWEFLRASGGGTVVAYYGRYDGFRQNALLARLIARNPAYEAGMAISAGLVLLKAVERESARCERARVAQPTGRAPGFEPLLARGLVAVLRSDAAGGLVDVSVVERVPVRAALMLDVVSRPELWPSFLSSVSHAEIVRRAGDTIDYRVGVSGLIVDVETLFRMQRTKTGVDALAIGGDVQGSRYRWDLEPAADGKSTIAVYRANAQLGRTSGILRLLFKFEPNFEHSANVAVAIIVMRAMTWRAQWLASHPADIHPD